MTEIIDEKTLSDAGQSTTPSPQALARRAAAEAQRAQRLASALRENLKRRKSQSRGRMQAPAPAASGMDFAAADTDQVAQARQDQD